MRRDDVRFAVVARDDGIRRITKITWRVGVVAAACSAVIAVAFGHHTATAASSGSTGSTSSSSSGGSSSGSSSSGSSSSNSQGGIQVPSQPPGPGQGPGQVTSGGTR